MCGSDIEGKFPIHSIERVTLLVRPTTRKREQNLMQVDRRVARTEGGIHCISHAILDVGVPLLIILPIHPIISISAGTIIEGQSHHRRGLCKREIAICATRRNQWRQRSENEDITARRRHTHSDCKKTHEYDAYRARGGVAVEVNVCRG